MASAIVRAAAKVDTGLPIVPSVPVTVFVFAAPESMYTQGP